jgi:hypothetical protein
LADAPAGAAPAGVEPTAATVAILADDLIWSTRLAGAVRAAGGQPKTVRGLDGLKDLLADAPRGTPVVIDLTARGYDGVQAILLAYEMDAKVIAVGQHDDAALRKAAIDAGAERVFTYRALFEDGQRLLGRWLAG